MIGSKEPNKSGEPASARCFALLVLRAVLIGRSIIRSRNLCDLEEISWRPRAAVPTSIGWRDHRTSVLLLCTGRVSCLVDPSFPPTAKRRQCRHCAPPWPESCSRVVCSAYYLYCLELTVSCSHISHHLASIQITKVISVWVIGLYTCPKITSDLFSSMY